MSNFETSNACASLAAIVASAGTINAHIIGFTGDVSIVGAPTSVLDDDLSSTSFASVFVEQTVLSTSAGFSVAEADQSLSPTDGVGVLAGTQVASIEAGSAVTSYFIHIDIPTRGAGQPAAAVDFGGTITFDTDILGIVVFSNLNGTDDIVGLPGVSYPTGNSERDQELPIYGPNFFTIPNVLDGAAVSDDRRTLVFSSRVANGENGFDQIRVITAIPSPPVVVVAMAGCAPLARRRR